MVPKCRAVHFMKVDQGGERSYSIAYGLLAVSRLLICDFFLFPRSRPYHFPTDVLIGIYVQSMDAFTPRGDNVIGIQLRRSRLGSCQDIIVLRG